MNKMIEVNGLKKNFGNIEAVKGISFYVERGKLFSFLGPNGAGKSTTIQILCTLLSYDGGTVTIDGMDLSRNSRNSRNIRREIGVVFQENMLDSLLTVRENLTIRAGLYTKEKAAIQRAVSDAARVTELNEVMDRPYEKLSGGQKRRADIARALLHTPKILFLDEPTAGLDPQSRRNIWETVRKLQTETGLTVFLTTHYMEEAAESDYVIVIDHGEAAAKGTPAELKTRFASDTLQISTQNEKELRGVLEEVKADFAVSGGKVIVKLPDTVSAIPVLKRCEPFIESFEVLQGTMDEAFIGITGKELRE
ncbi:Daunorubicin/doxorubicin resistance ATP-binding protein DrrA [Caprobacter fermentans]|uniref:Daunorubicin/doxorubicin resistance ATP-binding protein DrrA n=2 Tax=Caproicibacter fermentans TaxID=2576756 RepID=A0A6N8I0K4_9FIRM|nr:ABC transporter ATP-binding protein [Caproicibacter fermentans]MVB11257.1 Daunorubicin/doxorubicin resistance ATP-binding protein DrrA [Caproicibacter fermentans]OCN00116.1 ABC transporter [Clostridium sp. W14A]